MSVYNNSNPWNTVTASSGAQPTAPQWTFHTYSATTQTAAAPSGAQQRTFKVLDKSGPETSGPLSYAETTWIYVDELTRGALRSYGEETIASWGGKKLQKVVDGVQNRITVRDARIINSKAPAPVFKITAENVVEFTVDPIIRNRLKPITVGRIKPILQELGVSASEFNTLKRITRSVTRGNAEKYNDYFKKTNNTPNTDVFDLERVFNLAYNEPIVEKTGKDAFIKIEPEHQTKLKNLSQKIKQQLIRIIGLKFSDMIDTTQTISIKNAVLIHRISGEEIFNLSEKSVQRYSIRQEQVAELEAFLERGIDTKIRAKIHLITKGKAKTVSVEEAKELNSFLSKDNQFNFRYILSYAVQEAEEEVKGLEDLPPTSKRTKRRLSLPTASPKDSAALHSKRQKTVADAHPQVPSLDDQQWTTLDVNASFDQDPFSLPMPPQENAIPEAQVFGTPLDLPATGENEELSSSPTYSDPYDLGFDDRLNPLSPVGLSWEDCDLYLNM